MTVLQELESRLAAALTAVLGEPAVAAVTPAADLRFGDYQSNAAMVLAKQRKANPRALAQEIIGQLDLTGLASAEIAGPGFLNFRILPSAYAARAAALLRDARLGVPATGAGRTNSPFQKKGRKATQTAGHTNCAQTRGCGGRRAQARPRWLA